MRNLWTIAKREFNLYFASPVAYMVAFAVLAILGILFSVNILFSSFSAPSFSSTTGLFAFLLLFVVPALTMRLLAEEQRTGTIELLLTAPVQEWEIVTGKWLGAFSFIAVLVFATSLYAVVLNGLVTPALDVGLLVADYLGLLLLAGAMLAIGVSISAIFGNQIAASFATMATFLASWISSAFTRGGSSGMGEFFAYLSISDHYYNNFPNGVVDLGDMIFYLSVIVFFLFLASRIVESRRWR